VFATPIADVGRLIMSADRRAALQKLAKDASVAFEFAMYALLIGGLRGFASSSIMGQVLWYIGGLGELEDETRRKIRLRRMLNEDPTLLDVANSVMVYGVVQPMALMGAALQAVGVPGPGLSSFSWTTGPFDISFSEGKPSGEEGLRQIGRKLLHVVGDMGIASSLFAPWLLEAMGQDPKVVLGRRPAPPRVIQRLSKGYRETSRGEPWFKWGYYWTTQEGGPGLEGSVLPPGEVATRLTQIAALMEMRAEALREAEERGAEEAMKEVKAIEEAILRLARMNEAPFEIVEDLMKKLGEDVAGHLGFMPARLADALALYGSLASQQRHWVAAAQAAENDFDRLVQIGALSMDENGQVFVPRRVASRLAAEAYHRWVLASAERWPG